MVSFSSSNPNAHLQIIFPNLARLCLSFHITTIRFMVAEIIARGQPQTPQVLVSHKLWCRKEQGENQGYTTGAENMSLTHTAPSITLEPRRALAGAPHPRVSPGCCVTGVAPVIARIHCSRGWVHYAQETEKARATVTERTWEKGRGWQSLLLWIQS